MRHLDGGPALRTHSAQVQVEKNGKGGKQSQTRRPLPVMQVNEPGCALSPCEGGVLTGGGMTASWA